MNSIKTLNFSGAEFKTVLAQVIYPQGQSVLRSFKNLVTNSDEDIRKSLETLKEEKYEQLILSIKYFHGTKMTKRETISSTMESSTVADRGQVKWSVK